MRFHLRTTQDDFSVYYRNFYLAYRSICLFAWLAPSEQYFNDVGYYDGWHATLDTLDFPIFMKMCDFGVFYGIVPDILTLVV